MIKNRIAVKLGLTIMGLLLTVLLLLGIVANSIFSQFYTADIGRKMERLATHMVNMIRDNHAMALGMIGMMAGMNGMDAVVFDSSGKVMAKTAYYEPPVIGTLSDEDRKLLAGGQTVRREILNGKGEPFFLIVRPTGADSSDGALGVLSPIQAVKDAVNQLRSMLVLTGIGAVFLALGMTYIVSRKMSQPLLQMENVARRMAMGDLDARAEARTDDEIGSLARTLNELGDELKRYRDTRSEFFANISHELRTPITYLEGYSQVLSEGLIESEEEMKQYLQIIRDEARRMKRLVDDLFELSRMEEGKLSINEEWVDLSEVLWRVGNRIGPGAAAKGLELDLDIGTDVPLVRGDGNRMEQIFLNLLDNAVRYTNQGKIRVRLGRDHSQVVAQISDTGVGIPREELPYVFERFYRVEKSRSREFGGTGLGLAIVKKLVELQNGQIEVESEVNRGTTFTVRFPIVAEAES